MDTKKIGEELLSVVLKHEIFTRKKEVGQTLARRINEIKLRQRQQKRLVAYSVAATAAIFITIGSYLLSDNQIYTEEKLLSVVLPDNSQVRLESNSSLSYNTILWHFKRNVHLMGDAQFKVTSGEQFIVQTALGEIRVLGTEFSVRSSSEILNVECFEGSVKVTTKLGAELLHRGDLIECTPTGNLFTPRPDYYQYSHASVAEVLERIESIYDVIVLQKESCEDLIFDGVITTQSLTEALEVLTLSCDINYRIENNLITITPNE